MSLSTKNDVAWGRIFDTFPILDEVNKIGFYQITAKDINGFREARLMTKFDHYRQLPEIFKKHNLTIQPNSRSSYLIGKFDSYHNLQSNLNIQPIFIEPNNALETIDPTNLYSESSALLCAYHTGIIAEVLGKEVNLTVLGRMSTGKFNYFIKTNNIPLEIKVENSQCEIDAGFEGEDFFAIVEAKNTTVDDFLIRQLYYPYRLWLTKTRKPVIPLFMTYSNEIFSFYQYKFNDENNYNSIELISENKFQIIPNEIELGDVYKLLRETKQISEPHNIPFPQADSFSRIVDLLMQLKAENAEITKEKITSDYDFDVRQTQYYTRAAQYLGLIERNFNKTRGVFYTLSNRGTKVANLTPRNRNLALVESILEHSIFNQTLKEHLEQGKMPSKHDVIELMRKADLNLDRDGYTTIPRRASTVISWINWILKLTNP